MTLAILFHFLCAQYVSDINISIIRSLCHQVGLLFFNFHNVARSNKHSIHKAVYLLFCKFTQHVSGVNHTHHQDYIKLQLQPPVLVKLAWPRRREVGARNLWPVPETVVTFLCNPDDRCGWHQKHVEWTCRIIDRLLCVAPRWTINIDQRCTEK